jgi:hypothetical protein
MRSVLLIAGAVLVVSGPALAGEAAQSKKAKTVETAAGVAGSVAGSSVAGPVGGLVGGAVGRAVGRAVAGKPQAAEPAAQAAAQPAAPAPSLTPDQRTAMVMDAPPAWADPGQVQREQHAAPPPPQIQPGPDSPQ